VNGRDRIRQESIEGRRDIRPVLKHGLIPPAADNARKRACEAGHRNKRQTKVTNCNVHLEAADRNEFVVWSREHGNEGTHFSRKSNEPPKQTAESRLDSAVEPNRKSESAIGSEKHWERWA